MLEVYCDESEADLLGCPGLFLAGYVATQENWQAFSTEWRVGILHRFSIPYLHAVELRSRHASLYRHLDLKARRQLLAGACDIIASHIEAGFVACMRPSELDSLTTPVERSRWGGAYGICTEVVISDISRHVGRPDRIDVYFEDGHVNVGSAMLRIAAIKSDTESIEWPALAGVDPGQRLDHVEAEMRTSWMRIGAFGTVKKLDALPAQGSDLLAYLSATVMRNDDDPVYSDCLDQLIGRKPHAFRTLGPTKLAQLVDATRSLEQQRAIDRQGLYRLRGQLHDLGYITHALPWGMVVDKGPRDEQSDLLKQQVADLRKKT